MVVGGVWLAIASVAGVLIGRSVRAGNGPDPVDGPGQLDGPLFVEDILRAGDTTAAH